MKQERLHVEHVTVRFGGLTAVSDATLEVEPGGFTGLIGPNGAGKTTLFNVINGFQLPDRGRVFLGDTDVTTMPASGRAALGMGRTFQKLELFGRLSVFDNLMVAAEAGASRLDIVSDLLALPKRRSEEKRCAAIAETILVRFGLQDVRDQLAATIPVGTARILELGRALCAGPSVLLLDEPSSGLDSDETKAFGALLKQTNQELGITILIVEHDMDLVMEVCRDIFVLEFGMMIAHGAPSTIVADPHVRAAYLGEEDDEVAAETP
jgi:ABC-type branched-subunit amino acid transport system ATPase component